MARQNRKSFISSFTLAVLSGLLISLTTTGVAVAQNPVPLIYQPLAPDTAVPGGTGFTLTVNGTGFVLGARVNWNGRPLATTFVSRSQLTASVPASDVAKADTASVTVANPDPGGGSSNPVFFPVSLPVDLAFSASAFSAGSGPRSIGVGDLKGDGKLDLIVPDTGSGDISILLGNGDGTFRSPVSYSVGKGASSQFFQVAVGDLNGDGKLDLVVSDNNDNYVSVFIGNGDGTFKPGVTYAVGTNPTAVAIADLNGDGKLDLVVSNQNCPNTKCGTGTVSVLLGNGDGTFQPQVEFDSGLDPNWILVGDFNGDGKLDLAVVDGQGNSYTSAVLILLGNGDGTFTRAGRYPLNTNAASGTTADFNDDGKLDIAIADNIGLVSILLGNGDGTFQPRVDYEIGTGSFPWGEIALGDFNEDGNLDLAVADGGSNAVSVLLGNGNGTFQPQLQVSTGSFPQGVASGDFKRDGRLDLAVANLDDNTVSVLLQDGTFSLSPASLNFGAQLVESGGTKKVTLTNVGRASLTISAIAIAGTNAEDFVQSNTCGSSLGAGRYCTISVTFTPSQLGPLSASVTVTDSAPGSPQTVPLLGTGVAAGPNVTLSPATLTFATQLVRTTSPAQVITLSNYGTQTLTITGMSINAPFKQTHSCGKSLAAGASCTIQVTFTPAAAGRFTGTLSITDNAPDSPQSVSLNGAATEVELNPASLEFGVVQVGKSEKLAATLTNVGSTMLSITGITVAGKDKGEFSQTSTCGLSVAAGKSCKISVTFKPTAAGGYSADVSIGDNGGGSPQQVPLSGSGCVVKSGRCKTTSISSPAVQSSLASHPTSAVPRPMGPTSAGTRVINLVDLERDDPFLADGTKRELLVRFWYPASVDQGCEPAEYTSAGVWNYFSELTKLPLPQVKTNSCLDAPVASGAHPVIVFTHGYTGTFTDYTFLFEDLASRGYVVASIDHTYEATAVEFPDGRFVKSLVGSHLANTWRTDDQSLAFALSVRLDDLKFVLNELVRLNTSADNPFAGTLDLTKVALAGHSLGGLTTWHGVLQDARFKAAILLDPYLSGASFEPTETPVLLVTAGQTQGSEEECRLWSNLLGPRFSVNLAGSEHLTPSDAVWLAKGAIKAGAMGSDKTIAAVRDYVAAFLDANLRGKPADGLLTGPSSDYADAVVTTRNESFCGGSRGD